MELGPGALYFIPPEGSDPVYCGEVKSLEYTEEPGTMAEDGIGCPIFPLSGASAELTMELEPLNPKAMFFLTGDPSYMTRWAVVMRPRLAHLARYAKKGRARKKNVHRLVAFMIEELKR
jgi:hypothetical protein